MLPTQARFLLLTFFASFGPAALAGCEARDDPAPVLERVDPTLVQEKAASWDEFLGVRLRSVELYECGLGQDGPVMGHQYLTLAESGVSFEWESSDTVDSGTFDRNGARLLIRLRGKEFEGELDLERGVLIWGTIEFEFP